MRVHYSGLRMRGEVACGSSPAWKASVRPERVTCRSCLRIMRNIGQVAEGKLRAAEATEGRSDG